MKIAMIKRRFLIVPVIFFLLSFASFVYADILGSLSNKINNFIYFIDQNITEQIRKDFCIQYFSAIKSGEWKQDEFRVKFGNSVCAGKESLYLVVEQKKVVGLEDDSLPEVTTKNSIVQKSTSTKPLIEGEETNNNLVLDDTQIVYWTNIERVKDSNNLDQLQTSAELRELAKKRVEDMFAKTYFEHVSPTGDSVSKLADESSYKYIIIGENIALGNFGSSRELVKAWMNSEGHRENILNKNYTDIGVYSKEADYNGRKVWISAQVFSKPMISCIEPDVSKKSSIEQINNSLSAIKIRINNLEGEIKVMNKSDINKYNEKVTEYNNLAHTYNDLVTNIKNITTLYNSEVKNFNECIKVN